jgi:hypothetical protein
VGITGDHDADEAMNIDAWFKSSTPLRAAPERLQTPWVAPSHSESQIPGDPSRSGLPQQPLGQSETCRPRAISPASRWDDADGPGPGRTWVPRAGPSQPGAGAASTTVSTAGTLQVATAGGRKAHR